MTSDVQTNLSTTVSPAENITGREMLDNLSISTNITTRDVERNKQWLQARFNDADLLYARHRIQGQPSFEEYLDFIKYYEGMRNHKKSFAELTDELTKAKIVLESNTRSFQTLPHVFPNGNSYLDELKDKTNELTLSNDQLRRKEDQLSNENSKLKTENAKLKTENSKLKTENAKQKQKISKLMAGMMQMFFNWQKAL